MSLNLARESYQVYRSISFNVRSSSLDILLTTLGLGTVVILFLLYFIYLIVRATRRKRPGYTRSKADRPSWVLTLVVAGSALIFSTLLAEGILVIETEVAIACSLIKFLGQYTLGWILWAAAVNYKLIRKYYQLRLARQEAPHALLAIFLQVLPFALLAFFEAILARSFRDELDLCSLEVPWLIALYSMISLLLLIFLVSFIKIRRTIGAHHEIIRYGIFMSTSFLFPLADAIVKFTPSLVGEVWAGQMLVVLALLLVLGNMMHIFVLVLKGKHPLPKDILPMASAGAGTTLSLDSDVSAGDEVINDQPAQTLDDVNKLMAEAPVMALRAPLPEAPSMVLSRPRRSATDTDEVEPNFERFVDHLPATLANDIDRRRGYWVAQSRRRTHTVMEFDLDHAFRYLDDDSTIPKDSSGADDTGGPVDG